MQISLCFMAFLSRRQKLFPPCFTLFPAFARTAYIFPKPHFLLYWKLTKPLNCKPVYRYSTKYFETTNTAINKRIKNQEAPFCLFAGMTDDLISVRLRNIGQRGTPTQDYLINSDASTVTRPRCRLK